MTDADIIQILLRIMRESFRRPTLEFDGTQDLRDIFGIDSVQFVTLIMSLEEAFGVLLPEDRVDQLTNVQSLFDLVKSCVVSPTEVAS